MIFKKKIEFELFIIISDNVNMLKPQFPLVSIGNSFFLFENERYMNISNIKIFLGLLESTSNILSVTKQSKELLYIDNPYWIRCVCLSISPS